MTKPTLQVAFCPHCKKEMAGEDDGKSWVCMNDRCIVSQVKVRLLGESWK